MKKLGLLIMPLMTVSLLASCNNSTDICVVTFNSNGGSFVETQKIKNGSRVHEPEDPIRDKYNFAGWCLDGSIFEFSTKITQDITLTANWNKIPEPGVKHTISFSGSDCKAGITTDDLKDIFQISCEEGEINFIVAPNDDFALTNDINFLVDGVKVAPKSYTPDGSNYKLTFQLSGETLIYVDALPVSASYKVTFSGDDHCSMFYGSEPVTSSGIEIPVIDADPYYVKFTIKADDLTYMKPGHVTLDSSDEYSFNKDTGELFINLKSQVEVSTACDIYKTLEECNWAQIAEISKSKKAFEAFNVGDTKALRLNGQNFDHTIRIIDFNHDDLADGSGKAGITFEFANVITKDNKEEAYTTIWDGTFPTSGNNYDYRNSVLNDFLNGETDGEESVINMLPSDLKEVIKQVNKKVGVSTDSGNTYIATSFNGTTYPYPKLFPLAHDEIANHVDCVTENEGSKYQYYEEHTSQNDRVKNIVDGSAGKYYWLRSPYTDGNSNRAWRVSPGGGFNFGDVYRGPDAVAPAFCI